MELLRSNGDDAQIDLAKLNVAVSTAGNPFIAHQDKEIEKDFGYIPEGHGCCSKVLGEISISSAISASLLRYSALQAETLLKGQVSYDRIETRR